MRAFLPLILITVPVMLISCVNRTEKRLMKFIDEDSSNYANLERGYNENVIRSFKNSVEYGKIFLPNHDTINYWFLSHHIADDGYGGTIFEMPDGSREFIKGYFCCEVQLPNDGRFEDSKAFIKEMKKHNNVHP
jgi:hypothetical protein